VTSGTLPSISRDDALCQLFDMLTERLTNLELAVQAQDDARRARQEGKARIEDMAPAGSVLSGARHGAPTIVVHKHYAGCLFEGQVVRVNCQVGRGDEVPDYKRDADVLKAYEEDLLAVWGKDQLRAVREKLTEMCERRGADNEGQLHARCNDLGVDCTPGTRLLKNHVVEICCQRSNPSVLAVSHDNSEFILLLQREDQRISNVLQAAQLLRTKCGAGPLCDASVSIFADHRGVGELAAVIVGADGACGPAAKAAWQRLNNYTRTRLLDSKDSTHAMLRSHWVDNLSTYM
jgi:hypothetical protein